MKNFLLVLLLFTTQHSIAQIGNIIVYEFPIKEERKIEKIIRKVLKKEVKLVRNGSLSKPRQIRIEMQPHSLGVYYLFIETYYDNDIMRSTNRFARVSNQLIPICFSTDYMVSIKNDIGDFGRREHTVRVKRVVLPYREYSRYKLILYEKKIIRE